MSQRQKISALETFVEKTVQYVSVDQRQMTFPDFLILMSQRRHDQLNNDTTEELIAGLGSKREQPCLHPVRDLFKSYDIQRNGVIDANEMKGRNSFHVNQIYIFKAFLCSITLTILFGQSN